MRQYRTVQEAMEQPKAQVRMCEKPKHRPAVVMRPGKTAKDRRRKERK